MTEKTHRFKLSSNVKTLLWHIGLWALVIGIPMIFDSSAGSSADIRREIQKQLEEEIQLQSISNLNHVFYLVLILLFYVNYSFLIPKIFYPKGLKKYIGALILDYVFFSFVMLAVVKFFDVKFAPPLYIFILPFTLINAISLAIRVTATRMEEERHKQVYENEALKSELSFLRSQISPHFLFNIMNSIVAMSRVKPELVEPTLIQLSQLMRYMLYESDEKKVPIEKEIEYLENYIALQKMRFGTSILIQVDKKMDENGLNTEGVSDRSNRNIEPMLLIPFVENAFKHGVGMIRQPVIKIEIELKGNRLIFNVLNKFNTVSEEEKDFDSGIGLKNVRRRLELVYGSNHTLKAEAEGDVFVVNLTIDFKK